MIKTVLELDLVGYSTAARTLEEGTDVNATAALNRKVQEFVDKALEAIQLPRESTVAKTTGDGAILLFDQPQQAHRFAEAFHGATKDYNQTKTLDSAKRWFRMGAATGDVALVEQPVKDIAGVVIGDAVRLEAASRPGELVIDLHNFQGLTAAQKKKYGPEETVPGKRDEVFQARRWVVVPEAAPASAPAPGPQAATATGDRASILKLMERLYPDDRLDTLMYLLEMPIPDRPSPNQTLSARRAQVMTWCESPAGPGLERLETELRGLLEKDRP
jgi:hypothetical protein